MKDKEDIDYREVLNSTLSEIAAEVDTFLQENTDEIAERYGTSSPTEKSILDRLYQNPLTASEPIDVALGLRIFLADAHQLFYRVEEQRKTLPAPLLMYNMGVLWSYFCITTGKVDVPLTLKGEYRSELAGEDRRREWQPFIQERNEIVRRFADRAEEKYSSGSKLWHHDMVDHLLEQSEFNSLRQMVMNRQVSRKKILKRIGDVAQPYGRKRGIKKR